MRIEPWIEECLKTEPHTVTERVLREVIDEKGKVRPENMYLLIPFIDQHVLDDPKASDERKALNGLGGLVRYAGLDAPYGRK